MDAQEGCLWSQIVENQLGVGVVYTRRRQEPGEPSLPTDLKLLEGNKEQAVAPRRRISWSRSLSTRGRTSIIISAGALPCFKENEARRRPRRALPIRRMGNTVPDFSKERAYFEDIDSFNLLEESPSPKKTDSWMMGAQKDIHVDIDLRPCLRKWLIGQKLLHSSAFSISRGLHTPVHLLMERIAEQEVPALNDIILAKEVDTSNIRESVGTCFLDSRTSINAHEADACAESLEDAFNSLSVLRDKCDPFFKLLSACKQSFPVRLSELLSEFSNPNSITKIGEGTFGEAFRVGDCVCKIVPIDGDSLVNGETQKRSGEVFEEIMLCWALNHLRECQACNQNSCTGFIEMKSVRVCQGAYDRALIRAWEDWDHQYGSENDHPQRFSGQQYYVAFMLADGGKDLETFVLSDFNEAKSLLVQVAGSLAVAEVVYEFEHRDLHWGNILLTRDGPETSMFVFDGKEMHVKTFGLSVSIIDFTLSRLNNGDAIFFMDLTNDPELFEGPKGDKQFETYRKMKEVTEDCWEGSFPKTNVLWLQYLVDVLLLKKTFRRSAKDERTLRLFKKGLSSYGSAKKVLEDPFFNDVWITAVPPKCRNLRN